MINLPEYEPNRKPIPEGHMRIRRQSELTRVWHERDLRMTKEQLDRWHAGGINIQDAFPQLSKAEREFIKTGITSDEWEEFVPDE